MSKIPPPVIDSARLLAFAYNDADVKVTDRITLFVGEPDRMERLGEVPCLAICSNYANPKDILLFFCNFEWEPQGVIALKSVQEAKSKAEKGYNGILQKWQESPYSNREVEDFLRNVYKVNPDEEW